MRYRGSVVCLLGGIIWIGSSAALAADPKPSELTMRLRAVEEAQRSLAAELGTFREQLRQLDEHLGELREQIKQGQESEQGDRDQFKQMHEEVRGLYVESGGLKGDIAQLGKDIQGVDTSFGNFRFSSGALIAVLIVLQVVVIGLVLRGRS